MPEFTPMPVLIVDDDTAHAQSVQALLATQAIAAETMSSPRAALPRLLAGEFAVLVLDLNMPEMSGLEVLAQLHAADCDVRTIVLSGETEVAGVAPVLRLGAADFLPKPCDPDQLIATVMNVITRLQLERENAEMSARVADEQALHELMLASSPDALFLLGTDGSFRFTNSRFNQAFLRPGGPGDANPEIRTINTDLAGILDDLLADRRAPESQPRHREFATLAPDGSKRHFDLVASWFAGSSGHSESGAGAGLYGVIRDLTERHEAEAQRMNLQARLQQASKMEAIGQIAGGIAHDFNNILASMVGYADLVRKSHARLTADQVGNYLQEVVSAGHRAKDLIAQMLSFARASRGAPQPVNMGLTIEEVSRMLRAAIPSAIDLTTRFEEGAELVYADPVQLQQIIINLLINARDAIDGRGLIEVSVTRGAQPEACTACGEALAGNHTILTVRDSGHGISEAIRKQMFEMYFTTREPGKGSGIGLWLVNRLVHEYEGHITVSSMAGSGASFAIHLPALDAQMQPTREAGPAAADMGRIVVVDDEVSVANFMSEALRDAGYEVVVFTDSLQALRYLELHHEHVGALLTDQQMPLMTGTALAARVNQLRPDLPIAFVSGHMDSPTTTGARQEHVLSKPFRIDELVGLLEKLRSGPSAERATG